MPTRHESIQNLVAQELHFHEPPRSNARHIGAYYLAMSEAGVVRGLSGKDLLVDLETRLNLAFLHGAQSIGGYLAVLRDDVAKCLIRQLVESALPPEEAMQQLRDQLAQVAGRIEKNAASWLEEIERAAQVMGAYQQPALRAVGSRRPAR